MSTREGRPPTVLFAGDSVTDCGRRDDPRGLGDGYVQRLADSPALTRTRVVNRGVSGDRVEDLLRRWERDVVSESADVVSILIGINDVWRRYDSNDPTAVEAFARGYRRLLSSLASRGTAIVLVEPFLLPISAEQEQWREDLDPKIDAVRALATEFSCVLVPADEALGALAALEGAGSLAPDGVHPSARGHEALADLWLAHTGGALAAFRGGE